MCAICSKRFLYVSSLKKHLQNLHTDAISSDATGHQWEDYCKIIKSCEGTVNLTESFRPQDESSVPMGGSEPGSVVSKKHRRRKKKVPENSEEAGETTQLSQKNLPRDESHIQSTEITGSKSPPLSYTKENSVEPVKPQVEEAKRLPEPATPPAMETLQEEMPTALDKCAICTHQDDNLQIDDEAGPSKTLEERIQDGLLNLPTCPTYSLDPSEHHHVHCEFCGHPMIVHGNHVDFIHDAELHFVDETGAVYPHKLEISDQYPTGCRPPFQYPWNVAPTVSPGIVGMPGESGVNKATEQDPWQPNPPYVNENPLVICVLEINNMLG